MVINHPQFPRRKPNRLLEFNYSNSGVYFVTICTKGRKEFLSKIKTGIGTEPRIELSRIGYEIEHTINNINQNYQGIEIESYVIMPNHVHLLVVIESEETKLSLSDVVGRLKSFTTRRFNQIYRSKNHVLWQRSFYDHIVRDDDDYANVRNYIDLNPWKWKDDDYYSKE